MKYYLIQKPARNIALSYLILAGLWITFSDLLLNIVIERSDLLIVFQSVKGWFFVLVTSILLYYFSKKIFNALLNVLEDAIIAKEKLEKSELKFRRPIEQAADGIVVADKKGNIQIANNAFCNMLGYSCEEILKMNIADTYPPGRSLYCS